MDRVDVDCGTCSVRGDACGDCVISVLLGPPNSLTLAPDEQGALDALAGAGLVPPLRLVRSVDGPPDGPHDGPHEGPRGERGWRDGAWIRHG